MDLSEEVTSERVTASSPPEHVTGVRSGNKAWGSQETPRDGGAR